MQCILTDAQFERSAVDKIVHWGSPIDRIMADAKVLMQIDVHAFFIDKHPQLLTAQARTSARTPLISVLLHGKVAIDYNNRTIGNDNTIHVLTRLPRGVGGAGCGKSTLALRMALDADFPFTKLITPDTMVGYSETAKVAQINKV